MKIGIVNDLAVATEALRRVLALDPGHEVVWTARDGAEAVALCASRTPDLVLMDLIMPGMDGVEATRRIMAATPCAVLVVTASVGANASRVFEAMGHGALDAVDTPLLGSALRVDEARSGAQLLLAKIADIGRLIAGRSEALGAARWRQMVSQASSHARLVAIGASAGGPAALAKLLAALPADFPSAVVVVQHVDEQFAASMAEWLSEQSTLPVRRLQGPPGLQDRRRARLYPAAGGLPLPTVGRRLLPQCVPLLARRGGRRAADRDGARRRNWLKGDARQGLPHDRAGPGQQRGLRHAEGGRGAGRRRRHTVPG
jgi:DNA-binding NarL/FixJ family response regulator